MTCIQQRKILIFEKKKKKFIMLHLHFRAYLDILSAQVAIIKLQKKKRHQQHKMSYFSSVTPRAKIVSSRVGNRSVLLLV